MGGRNLPYLSNDDLPPAVQRVLPPHAQDIYRAVFNSAWQQHNLTCRLDEAAVHRIAWGAVKRQYRKLGDMWVPRSGLR